MINGLVSVVMPAFDEERFIAEALASVIAQTYSPVEVIVVDDGSADATAAIAAEFGARVLSRPHRGEAAARNAGLRIARGEYWTVLDGDDVMPADRLERQVEHLKQHPELGMVLGLTEAFVTPGEARPAHWNRQWDDGPFPGCTGTLLARRTALDLAGAYDESWPVTCDFEWFARARDAGVRAGQLDHVVLRYRIHSGNASSDRPAVQLAMLRVLRESLQRRTGTTPPSRAAGGDQP